MSGFVDGANTPAVIWPPEASHVAWAASSSGGGHGPAVRRVALPQRGRALVASRALVAGDPLWTERPVAWHRTPGSGRSADGKRAACDHCGRWFDAGSSASCGAGGRAGSGASCPGACGVPFCSGACFAAADAAGHFLLCAARQPAGPAAAAPSAPGGALWRVEQQCAADGNPLLAAHVGCAAKLLARAATRFLHQLQTRPARLAVAGPAPPPGRSGGGGGMGEAGVLTPAAAALAADAAAGLDCELAPWARPPWTACTHAFRSGRLPPGPWSYPAPSAPAQDDAAAAAAVAAAGPSPKSNATSSDEEAYSDDEPQFPDRDRVFQDTLQPAYFAGALQQPRDAVGAALVAAVARAWDEGQTRAPLQATSALQRQLPQGFTGAVVASAWAAGCLSDGCFDGVMGCLRTNNQAVRIRDPGDATPPPPASSEVEPCASSALQGTALYAVFATMNHACEPSVKNDPLRLPGRLAGAAVGAAAEEETAPPLAAPLADTAAFGDIEGCEVVGVNVFAAKAHRAGDEVRRGPRPQPTTRAASLLSGSFVCVCACAGRCAQNP